MTEYSTEGRPNVSTESSDATAGREPTYRYTAGERLPVEVLVFDVDPANVEDFLAADHDIWTMGEAETEGFDRIPFLSKEVWIDDANPGRITLVFVWDSLEAWMRVGEKSHQMALQAAFDRRFPHRVRLVRAYHEDSSYGIHRWSRFERID